MAVSHRESFAWKGLLAWFLSVVLAATLTGTGSLIRPLAAAPAVAQLSIEPVPVMLPQNGSAVFAVQIREVQNLYGVQLDLRFDPAIMQVVRIEPGTFLSPDFVIVQQIDNRVGVAKLAYTQLAPAPPKSGTGDITLITAQATDCLGTTPLRLENVVLTDPDGHAVSHSLTEGVAHSGQSPEISSMTGIIWWDQNGNGIQELDERPLAAWPVYLQRFSLEFVGPIYTTYTDTDGAYLFDTLACGRYGLWSRDGRGETAVHVVRIGEASGTVSVDIGVVSPTRFQLYLPTIVR